MNNTKANLLLSAKAIAGFTKIPTFVISSDKVACFPNIDAEINPVLPYLSKIRGTQESLSYIITENFFHFGIIKLKELESYLVLGPTSNIPLTKIQLSQSIRDFKISPHEIGRFYDFFYRIPAISINEMWQLMSFINSLINHESISPIDLVHLNNENQEEQKVLLLQKQTVSNYQLQESYIYHDTYDFEQQFLYYIEQGDVRKVKELLSDFPDIHPGKVADSNLRQMKNIFISSITLITRSAIRGGMNKEEAYRLSDLAISEMERLENYEKIDQLQLKISMMFVNAVAEAIMHTRKSKVTSDIIDYVKLHINEPLNVQIIADNLDYSRSYISRKFKEDKGLTIMTYITKSKIEIAKNLLLFSDKMISEISTYLCFSSQSYFQNVFKKYCGQTPYHFRIQSQR